MPLTWPADVDAAIAAVRNDSDPSDWMLAGYDTKETLKLLGAGTGGIDSLRAALVEGDVCYGLVRSSFNFEKVGSVSADTIKFTFIYWRPENIPVMRKMKIGIFEGTVKSLFSPYHADIEAAEMSEVDAAALAALLGGITMRTDRTTSDPAVLARALKPGQLVAAVPGAVDRTVTLGAAAAAAPPRVPAAAGGGGGGGGGGDGGAADKRSFLPADGGTQAQARFATGSAAGASVTVRADDEAALTDAIRAIRSDAAGEDDWCLLGYADKKTLVVLGRGTGGCDAMMAALPEAEAAYGLFKTTDCVDRTVQAKHCFVVWQPETLTPMRKALISTHKGAVTARFRPYHVDFFVTARNELSDSIARDHISGLTGSRSHVTDRAPEEAVKRDNVQSLGGVTRGVVQAQAKAAGASLEIGREDGSGNVDDLRAALAKVRSDTASDADTDWALAAFDLSGGAKRLVARGSGGGGAVALRDAIANCGATYAYALLRITEVIDKSVTVKFALVVSQPEAVPAMVQGQLGVLRGAVTPLFEPVHGSVFLTQPDELTDDSVLRAVSVARGAGGASKVTW